MQFFVDIGAFGSLVKYHPKEKTAHAEVAIPSNANFEKVLEENSSAIAFASGTLTVSARFRYLAAAGGEVAKRVFCHSVPFSAEADTLRKHKLAPIAGSSAKNDELINFLMIFH